MVYMRLKLVNQHEPHDVIVTKENDIMKIHPTLDNVAFPVGQVVHPKARIYKWFPNWLTKWLLSKRK